MSTVLLVWFQKQICMTHSHFKFLHSPTVTVVFSYISILCILTLAFFSSFFLFAFSYFPCCILQISPFVFSYFLILYSPTSPFRILLLPHVILSYFPMLQSHTSPFCILILPFYLFSHFTFLYSNSPFCILLLPTLVFNSHTFSFLYFISPPVTVLVSMIQQYSHSRLSSAPPPTHGHANHMVLLLTIFSHFHVLSLTQDFEFILSFVVELIRLYFITTAQIAQVQWYSNGPGNLGNVGSNNEIFDLIYIYSIAFFVSYLHLSITQCCTY